tara:strand:- start:1450 stop:1986 length:537 start_codon:yes stop_codon:yes gene_type:complete
MGIFSKEEKSMLAFKGIDVGVKLFEDYKESSKLQRQKEMEDNKISVEEYKRVVKELEEHQEIIYNLISDTELHSKFRKTEEIFVSIIKIIMFDLEFDNKEIFENLNLFIDNEKFIEGHETALKKRKKRLENEYDEELKQYEIELKDYKIQLDHHKSQNFFKKLINSVAEPPKKPQRRV